MSVLFRTAVLLSIVLTSSSVLAETTAANAPNRFIDVAGNHIKTVNDLASSQMRI